VKAAITLFDPARDLRVVVHDERAGDTEEEAAGIEFMWTEGNYACDCNRRLFIARELGEPEPAVDAPCGHSIVLEKIEIDGDVVFDKSAAL
jgi:hypothetical protein